MIQEDKPKRISDILARETGGRSYKSHKYCLDEVMPAFVEYGEKSQANQWEKKGETRNNKGYVLLSELSKELKEQSIFNYFLDGSRHVYKVDDIGYRLSGNRTVIYPVMAGQIAVGCCRREKKKLKSEKIEKEIVLAVPDKAESSGKKKGFFQALAQKMNVSAAFSRARGCGWNITTVLPYSTAKDEQKYEDKGTAKIQDKMIENEQKLVAKLAGEKKLGPASYLIKDGSLEYKPSKEMKYNARIYQKYKNNYNYVIGISKKFNPEICQVIGGKPNPGFIADLPLYARTPVACFKDDFLGDIRFAVWYIRIREKRKTINPFDGILKVEKIMVTEEEVAEGINSDLADLLSAHIVNERNPVCFGSDFRWPNHLYPVYLTEKYVKSHYLRSASFLQLF